MSSNTLSFKRLLAGAVLLPSLAFASPIGDLNNRDIKIVSPSLADITPNVIKHGTLDDEALERLKESLPGLSPSTPSKPDRVKRDLVPSSTIQGSLTVATIGAFVSVDVGDIKLIDSNPDHCHSQTLNGPMEAIQVFMGAANLRAINATSSSGNSSSITSKLEGSTDAGVFKFNGSDRIADFWILENRGLFMGFNFTTEQGKTYSAMATALKDPPAMVKVPVGSGMLARMRVQYCDVGLIGHVGWDFLDELQSVSISNIAYSGFTNNIMPAGPGETMSVGSQIVDNRNGTDWQMITIMTQDAVTKSRTLSVANMWNVGGGLTIDREVGVPFVGKTKFSVSFTWMVQKTTTEEKTESETLTKASTVNLRCPARKYCVGTSFFTIFKMDVDVEATFRANTKTGYDFFWVQKGRYQGADSLAQQLQVDESDNVIAKRADIVKLA
ncbi:hypothetical protein CCHL11_01002 [Colletotrichum chlorophyti]|uniref:Natterin-like protein n=1 Tax=Colletotrichum chlorophyti TaxID=708187 RepID=A0A1Q8S7R9_9PEZI|nr:hypothetical protein CCHL11_01002 [Colletotrichum chlorophyti]